MLVIVNTGFLISHTLFLKSLFIVSPYMTKRQKGQMAH